MMTTQKKILKKLFFTDEDVLVLLKNGIKIRRRKNKRVIRYVGYSQKNKFRTVLQRKNSFFFVLEK